MAPKQRGKREAVVEVILLIGELTPPPRDRTARLS